MCGGSANSGGSSNDNNSGNPPGWNDAMERAFQDTPNRELFGNQTQSARQHWFNNQEDMAKWGIGKSKWEKLKKGQD